MKTLYVVRHAKSSWRDSELADIDRPLKARGVRDAQEMAVQLVKDHANPDYIISSPAVRAIHTAIIFARTIELPFHRIIIRNRMYASSSEMYFQIIGELDEEVESVMIFGHDPTATTFVNLFLDQPLEKIPTAGVVGFTFNVQHWAQIKGAKAKLISRFFPKG